MPEPKQRVSLAGLPLARLVRWLVCLVVVFLVLVASPLARMSLAIETTSSAAGPSVMTFDASREPAASTVILANGGNDLRFHASALALPFESQVQWIPCLCGTRMTVTSIRLRSHVFSRALSLASMTGVHGATLSRSHGAVSIDLVAGRSLNPRVDIVAPLDGFAAQVAGILAAMAVVITGVLFVLSVGLRRLRERGSRPITAARGWIGGVRGALEKEQRADLVTRVVTRLPVSRILFWMAVVVLGINVVMMFAGAGSVGIWIDEDTHVQRLRDYFSVGWYLPPNELAGTSPLASAPDVYVYGPVSELFSHFIAVIAGAESPTTVSTSVAAYSARHVSVVITALAGLGAVSALVRLILRSWRWGVIAAAAVTAIPAFTGWSMFNPKDIAVATGYSIVTLALALLAAPSTLLRVRRSVGAALLLALGMVVMMGTRPGTWPAIIAGVAILVVAALVISPSGSSWQDRWRRAIARGALALGGVLVGGCALLFIYPAAFGTPLTLLKRSFSSSAAYENGGHIRSGYGYIPEWLLAQVPTILLIVAVFGVVLGVRFLVRVLRRREVSHPTHVGAVVALAGSQLVLVPGFALLQHSVLYNGLRQITLMLPMIGVFFAIALAALSTWRAFESRGAVRRWALVAVAVVALVLPTVESTLLFPYAGNYVTAIGTHLPYSRALIGRADHPPLPSIQSQAGVAGTNLSGVDTRGAYALCPSATGAPSVSFTSDQAVGECSIVRPSLLYAPDSPTTGWVLGKGGWVQSSFNGTPPRLDGYSHCSTGDAITRPTLTGRLLISALSFCEPKRASIAVPATLDFDADENRRLLTLNWSGERPDGVWSVGRTSGIELRLPSSQSGALTLTLTGHRRVAPGEARSLSVMVNGVTLGHAEFTQNTDQSTVIRIPARVVASEPGHLLQIQLVTPDPISNAALLYGPDKTGLGYLLEGLTITPGSP